MGDFTIDVAPGSYNLTGTSPMINGGQGRCRAETPVVVASGQILTHVDVTCNIK